jgi:hypothetical protein
MDVENAEAYTATLRLLLGRCAFAPLRAARDGHGLLTGPVAIFWETLSNCDGMRRRLHDCFPERK